MQIKSRELLKQGYMKKRKLKLTSVYKNSHSNKRLANTSPRQKNLCHDLEYFVDNVKQPVFFLVSNTLILQVSSCSLSKLLT